jgi:parallel beta-helix repeat protein
MDATIIQVLAPLEVTADPIVEGFFSLNPPSRGNKYPMLVIFMAGDITVSDMTFKVSDPKPVNPWCFDVDCGQTALWGLLGVIGNTSANLLVERVGFEGGTGPSAWLNHTIDDGPFFLGLSPDQPLTGTFKLVSSHIRNGEDSLLVMGVRNAKITIGGSPSDGNVIENGAIGGGFIDLDHSVFEYSYNNVTVGGYPAAGVIVAQGLIGLPQEPSQVLIQHNTFKATAGWEDGIWVVDLGPPSGVGKTADFVVSDNTIEIASSEADPAWAGIDAVFAVGAVISNNRVSGSNALIGIAAEGSSQCMVLGNNVQQLNALWAPVALVTTDWGWGPMNTSYCTVVGGNSKTNVYDEGTKNVLVGVNNMQGNPPGPAIKEAMQRKRDLLESLRRR